MPERHDQHEQPDEFTRLSEFARRGTVLSAPDGIRARGTLRIRQRKVGQVALGAGALAVVAGLSTSLALTAHGSPGTTLTAGATRPSATPTGVWFTLPTSVNQSKGNEVASTMQRYGFTVTTSTEQSSTVPSGNAIGIVDAHHHSLLGRPVSLDTPVTVLISTGPAH